MAPTMGLRKFGGSIMRHRSRSAQVLLTCGTLVAMAASWTFRPLVGHCGDIYWIESGNGGKIRNANRDGTAITDVVTNAGYARALAVDLPANMLYWSVD